jgi:hypothetical protein
VAENPAVAGHGEQIEALHIVEGPVALRVLGCLRFLTMVKPFTPRSEFTSPSEREPDMARDEEAASRRFPGFRSNSHLSVQNLLTLK